MGIIRERLADIARRCGDLSPLAEPVRQVLIEDNRERALAGVDADGNPFAPLAPSTVKQRQRMGLSGPPQAAHGPQSRVITGYVVDVQAGPGRLSFLGSWPALDWIRYHITGTSRMPQRNPMGFRRAALDRIRGMLRNHVMK